MTITVVIIAGLLALIGSLLRSEWRETNEMWQDR